MCQVFVFCVLYIQLLVTVICVLFLDRTRPELLSEDTQRRFVQEVQSLQYSEVAKQLEDFRLKKSVYTHYSIKLELVTSYFYYRRGQNY